MKMFAFLILLFFLPHSVNAVNTNQDVHSAGRGTDFLFGNRYLSEISPRTVLSPGKECRYLVSPPAGRNMQSGKLLFNLWKMKRGNKVDVSVISENGQEHQLGSAVRGGITKLVFPASLFPSAKLVVRICCAKGKPTLAHFQFMADTDGEKADVIPPPAPVDGSNEFFRTDYGEMLPGGGGWCRMWTAQAGWKIPRRRDPPTARAAALRMECAANEAEAVQLVVNPTVDLEDVRVTARLEGISAEVEVLRVGYVPVRTGSRSRFDWPDPLPPQDDSPLPVAANVNQPFWIRVKPSKGTSAGTYRGEICVTAERSGKDLGRETFTLPMEVKIFGFEFPDTVTCNAALGIDMNMIGRYQDLRTPDETNAVRDLYMRTFKAHHISSRALAPNSLLRVKWEDGVHSIDWSKWDAAMESHFSRYGKSVFQMPLEGMGHGNSHSHRTPSVGGMVRGTPGYEKAMEGYLGEVVSHLKSKGWLDYAYTIWFDEPEKKDYPYVMEGMDIVRRYAPGLRRMLTEEPVSGLLGGPNLWCAHTHRLKDDPEAYAKAKAQGDEIWWYLCWLPKAPYANLFIDQSAVQLRTWMWQTWAEGITGVLIWQTVRWTSSGFYSNPSQRRNPYVDPMCRHSGGQPFGNGDGLLLYPPKGRMAPPVDTVRLEMLREGIEDYEYFVMLRRLDPCNSLLRTPETVSKSLTEFSHSPMPMMEHRRKLAAAIEAAVSGR